MPRHFGGGEKYLFDVASSLADDNQVAVAISSTKNQLDSSKVSSIRESYALFLNRKLSQVDFIASPLGTNQSFLTKLLWTKKFDVIYYLTDGSLFFSLAKKNILHIQIPFTSPQSGLINRLKLASWHLKNTNSKFTKKVIEKHWRTKIDLVHQPMVDAESLIKQSQIVPKEKMILHVGRFFKQLHSKKQDVLVDIFRQLRAQYPAELKGWKLALVGSVEDKDYLKKIQQLARGIPVQFYHQVTRSQLLKLYGQAAIYWHATGYGVDQEIYPEKMEHFGISTVEAMVAQAAPVVIGKGGQVEIMGQQLTEWMWLTKEECIDKTLQLIANPELLKKVSLQAAERAKLFSPAVFKRKLQQMIA